MPSVSADQVRTIGRFLCKEKPHLPPLPFRVEVSIRVIERFLGAEWTREHLGSEAHPFFGGCHAPTLANMAGARRVYELADMLLNLQKVEGFDSAVQKLREDSVETGFAAMEVAKVLFRSGVRFRFIEPSQVKGSDYDLEAFPDDLGPVAIEAKCKLESVAVSPGAIKHALDAARTQLPPEGRGVIFLRVPREWATEGYLRTPFAEVARGVLRNSSRVAGILICSNQFVEASGQDGTSTSQASMMVIREFWSQNPKFAGADKWGLCRHRIGDDARWMMVAHLLGQHLTPARRAIARELMAWKARNNIA